MDDQTRKKMISALNSEKLFKSDYSRRNQLWFLEKVVRRFEGQGLSDSAVKDETRKFVKKAVTIVKDNRDFSLTLVADGNKRFNKRFLRSKRKQRVEILYGAMAFNHEFTEANHLKYLLFIAKRRFRTLCRTFIWVNPNSQGYFRYGHKCKTNQAWRVNIDAAQFWERLIPSKYAPIKLKKQQNGQVDPVSAIMKLFVKQPEPCNGNLLDCSTVASCLFMDSLFETKKPSSFLNKLASKSEHYLTIHQLGFPPTPNFVDDTTDEGILQTVGLPTSDLQVGDRVYIFNHQLYRVLRPFDSWRGEHAFVYRSGNRDYRSKKGFFFGGHGKEGTLFKFYTDFLTQFKTDLAMARQLMIVHLAFMTGGAAAIAPGTVSEEEHDIIIGDAPETSYRLIQYDKNVLGRDYTKFPSKSTRKPKRGSPAFVIIQSKTEYEFYISRIEKPEKEQPLEKNFIKTISEIVADGRLFYPIKFKRLSSTYPGQPPESIYAPYSWGIEYIDLSTNTSKTWSFYEVIGGVTVRNKELTYDDLFQAPFGLFTQNSTKLEVIQPKVDFGAGHQGFLTANGAL